jgi:hypothetical protein
MKQADNLANLRKKIRFIIEESKVEGASFSGHMNPYGVRIYHKNLEPIKEKLKLYNLMFLELKNVEIGFEKIELVDALFVPLESSQKQGSANFLGVFNA